MSFLDPAAIRLERRDDQPPTLSIAGDLFFNVKIRQAFPLSFESRYITFFDQEDEYLGIVADPGACDEETGRIIRDEIEWRYFRPKINRVVDMEGRGGTSFFFRGDGPGRGKDPDAGPQGGHDGVVAGPYPDHGRARQPVRDPRPRPAGPAQPPADPPPDLTPCNSAFGTAAG